MKKRSEKELKDLHQLALSQTPFPQHYDPRILEKFLNKHPQQQSWTSFVCTEFTSLCPKTGQPDFARLFINYVAHKWMVESKSLKLYLGSFRQHGGFHEDCIQTICDDLSQLLQAHYLEVIGEFTPRGGITIYPFCQSSSKQKKYQQLQAKRFSDYAPGKYSVDLSRIY
jgi:7-cyano-7-deazaguanine reductase